MASGWLVIAVALGACRSDDGTGLTANVFVMTGAEVGTGITVLSHREDGTAIDRQITDATGRAIVFTEPGGWASAIFPAALTSAASIAIITTPLPATGDLVVTGPPRLRVPVVAGAIAITAPPLAADRYDVDLGCATIAVAAFPVAIDVAAACAGSDATLDVLVRGYSANTLAGYAAARVPLAAGMAAFDLASWSTTGTDIPVALDTVSPMIALSIRSDAFTFATPPITDHATAWTGLVADASIITATTGSGALGAITTRTVPALPASIAFGTADFLPPIASEVVLDDRATLALHWTPIGITADSLQLHAAWPATVPITWDVLLPPDADHVRFPVLDSDLAARLEPPALASDLATDLRAIAAGPDEVLISHVAGFR